MRRGLTAALMTRRARRGTVVVAAVGVLFAAAAWYARPAVSIGVAFKAKTLCSGVFVSGRAASDVLADLERDDLEPLRHISASVDPAARSVTASAFGLLTRRAEFRDGLGCALVLDGLTPPAASGPYETNLRDGQLPVGEPVADQLSAVLERAFSESNAGPARRTQAVVIVHQGRVVAERYANGIASETPLAGWSMSKTAMNALVGILVGEGRLALDAPVELPEWQGHGDPRAAITLDHLLRMSSGLRFDEGMSSPRSDVMQMLFATGDAAGYAAGQPLEAAPGAVWRYSSGSTNIVARVIRHVLRDDAEYYTFPRRTLFDRLGMTGATLETDASGTYIGSSYMYATARDWARFGLLYLMDGVWNGGRILPDGWIRYTTTPAPADPRQRYGAHVWLHVPEEYAGPACRLPADAFHAAGHEGQFVTIVPSRDTVIVRLGRTRALDAWDHCAFVRDVLSTLAGAGPARQERLSKAAEDNR